jgi:hypothetical protein
MAVQMQGPSLYELGYGETKITYAPAVGNGSPRLRYAGPLGEHSFEGDSIELHESARGLEVSVKFETHLQLMTLTVFVPELALGDALEQSFHTVGIHTTQRRLVAGGPGADLVAQPLELDGVARLLDYGTGESTLLPTPRGASSIL